MKSKIRNHIMGLPHTFVSLAFLLFVSFTPLELSAKSPNIAVEKRDSDGDGKVSRYEWDKSNTVFDKIDDNGDGFLTADEFAKHWGMPLPGKRSRSLDEAGTLDETKIIIADVHMHPHPSNDAVDVLAWMNRNGVKWAGLGSMVGGRAVREDYRATMGERYIPFGGQSQLNKIYRKGGNEALENPNHPDFVALMAMLEEDFKAGKLKGVGEVFANSRTTSKSWFGRKMKIDAPTNRMMLDLVARYGGALSMHVQWDKDSVQQLKKLAEHNVAGNIIMAHCGSNTEASDIREVLKLHSNLYCDLSARHPPKLHWKLEKKKPEQKVFSSLGIVESWRALIEEFPERFMVGTDTKTASHYDEGINTIREGLLANLQPETAEKVAYLNAKRLLNLH